MGSNWKYRRIIGSLAFCAGGILWGQSTDVVPVKVSGESVLKYLTQRAEDSLTQRRQSLETIQTPAAAESYRDQVKARLQQLVGPFPPKTPLHAAITGQLQRSGYRVENLVLESRPRFFVTANLYIPENQSPPFPAVLGTAGHSISGKAAPIYQRAWINLARRGFLVLAFDPPGQGERSEYYDFDRGRPRIDSPVWEHNMAGLQCLLTGRFIANYFIWDGIRAIDYLCSRSDVDPRRIAVAGNSGGGTQAAYLAALEPRLAAATSSCYMTSFRQLWLDPGPQDAEQVFPGFLSQKLDLADWALAATPRSFQILSAEKDFFPIEGARSVYQELSRIWTILGKSDQVDFFEYPDVHGWSQPRREATYRWMERQLLGKQDHTTEGTTETEEEFNLYATSTGQLATSLQGESIHSLNRAYAEQLLAERKSSQSFTSADLKALLRRYLGIEDVQGNSMTEPDHIRILTSEQRQNYKIQSLLLQTEPNIWVPATLYIPDNSTGPFSAVLYCRSTPKSANTASPSDPEVLAQAGNAVLDMQVRGTGPSAYPAGKSGYDAVYQGLMRALLVGKTIVGMQVVDLQGGLEYLFRRRDINSLRISIMSKGDISVAALITASLDRRIQKVAVEGGLSSYMALVRSKLHENWTAVILPGLLKDLDLPELAAVLAPRPLWIINATGPTGVLLTPRQAEEEYATTCRAYRQSGKPEQIHFGYRTEENPFIKIYQNWLGL